MLSLYILVFTYRYDNKFLPILILIIIWTICILLGDIVV